MGNELQLRPRLWLSSGLSFADIDRDVRIDYTTLPNPTTFPKRQHYQDSKVAPRLGLRYQASDALQVFGNVSRSIDPPVTWYYASTGVGYARPMTAQEANTAEIGIRGKTSNLDGSLTLYRSWVKKELLSVVVIPAALNGGIDLVNNYNASPTIHQGVEAGLGAKLWETPAASVTLRQAYTLNDFFYENDAVFGSNQLPSLPRHVYQAEILYQRAGGFYGGVNLRSASSYYVDYANTYKAPGYTIFGLRLGYEDPGKRWNLFLDARNLGDKHYVTASSTTYNANGKDSATGYFYPGDGFGVTVGGSFRF